MGVLSSSPTLRALLACSWMVLVSHATEPPVKHEQKLIKDLFADYDVESRPVVNLSQPVVVYFGIAYSEIVDLDEKNQALTSNVWVRQRWTDAWLTWNSSEYGGLDSIHISPSFVWKPDIVLYNNVNDESNGEQYLFKTKVIVSSDGTVTWYSPSILKSSCKIDVKDFPFDTQTCKITFGSWTFHGFKLDLHFFGGKASAELSKFTPSGEWELLSVDATRNVIYYSCCPEPYPDLTFNVKVKRRTLFYVNNLIVPCVVLALLTATAFVFPPESGERVSLVMTILLGMTVFMIIFTESIPSTSEVVPLIGKYFTAVLVEIALCLIATCITLKLHYHDPRLAVPAWTRVLLFDVIGRVVCPFSSRHFRTRKILKVEEMPTSPKPDSKAHRRVHPLVELKEQNGTVAKDHGKAGARTDACGARSVSAVGMDKICSYIDCLATEDVRRSEWHMAAKVIDRLFLAIFILTFVITTFAMLFNR